ncbi:V-type proton ATPase 116 kDa subunit a 1-like [Galleria mellonella]|uniref:V-type proton ATPase subunit a n=1 Tax=Galleria mellonella TaxID=7137 RepID=A0ABM3MMY0_GALME|nr:V-type proton ATPase 116 kDa subunit a 1-like [Galleria mellonella]
MGCMLRSDPMSLFDMYVQPEAAFETMCYLGNLGCCQFLDMNPDVQPFQKNYVSEMCRCAEMERKLTFIESEILKDNIHITHLKTDPKPLQPNEMVTYENMLEKWENDIVEMATNEANLMKNYIEMSEMYYVLEHIGPMLGDTELRRESILFKKVTTSSGGDIGLGGQLMIITGVVRRKICFNLEMMLWRISRGNIYYKQATYDKIFRQPNSIKEIRKVAFLAICQGEELKRRMEKICNGFRVNLYPCPKTYEERTDMLNKLGTRLLDIKQVLKKTAFHRCKTLRTIARQIRPLTVQVKKAKAIYHNLNFFNMDITKKCLIGQCWIADRDATQVHEGLETCSQMVGTNVYSFMSKRDTDAVPPTFHRTNRFTKGFQALINAYGDSTYRELNPGLYTIITFPFLFSLMFGDICHGIILVVFGLWMIFNEKKFIAQRSTNEIWNIFFGGRYVIMLMGVFSMYAGFIYNDWFSRAIILMDPYWINNLSLEQIAASSTIQLDPKDETGPVYMFGIDPIWTLAKNKIMIENSIKMKLSIIIGIVHMMFGIFLSLFNYTYFKRKYAIYLQFIPEILFLVCLFLWLVIMIYFKWFTYSGKSRDLLTSAGCAPQILILFIDMVLLSTTKPVEEDCEAYMFKSQQTVQKILLVIALLCVPVMLFGQPIYLYTFNKRKRRDTVRDSDKQSDQGIVAQANNYHVNFGELMIHQGVHTIEYVLSTISHTASYLRLWALSLAHAQLSEMLWSMIFVKLALSDHTIIGSVKVFIIFAIWAVFTVSILVVMEGLSAFLHTLRLHWVEFMSKFYSGGGWVFQPFSFKGILVGEEDKINAVCKKRQKYLQE